MTRLVNSLDGAPIAATGASSLASKPGEARRRESPALSLVQARCLEAVAVALLLERSLTTSMVAATTMTRTGPHASPMVTVKITIPMGLIE